MRDDDLKLDLSDLVIVLLAGNLAGLRDRLAVDGYTPAAALVADLVDVADDYITNCIRCTEHSP